jgi:hypothetical protein
MSYESAPATQLVATHCAACGRPLVDAASLAAHLGPDCREKYGVGEIDPATREEANVHIFRIALLQEGTEVAERLTALRALGFSALADRITKRLAPRYTAVITQEGESFAVKAGYDLAMRADLGLVRGRRWDKARKLNTFPNASKRDVFLALRKAAPGATCLGPRGEFTL